MNFKHTFRVAIRWSVRALRVLAWCAGTAWLGARAIVWLGILLGSLPEFVAETRHCPRGHAVPQFDVYDCRCGARHEGWAFGRCTVCGESTGWIPCAECGLPVLNPLRRLGW